MSTCPKCGFMSITRSSNQNRAYWDLYIEPMANEAGVTPMEMHEDLKRTFFDREIPFKTKFGVAFRTVSEGSTTTMTTKEFSDYMAWVKNIAFDFYNITIQEPNEAKI